MTFYQRIGLAGALVALFVGTTAEEPWNFFWIVIGGRQPAQVAWMIPILMAGSIFLLLTGKDPAKKKVESKWYGVLSAEHLAGPFLRMEDVTPGCHGATPHSILQVFGGIDNVGVILHPISQKPPPLTSSYYVREGGSGGVFFGAYYTPDDAVFSLPPDEVDFAEVVEIAQKGDAVIVVNYWTETPESDEAGKAYWIGSEFEPES